jgi:hypothetical protein
VVSGAVAVVAAIVVFLYLAGGEVNGSDAAIASAVVVAGVLGFLAGVLLYRSSQ